MGLFDLFGRKTKRRENEDGEKDKETEIFEAKSDMRVEVTTFEDDRLLFVAKLMGMRGDAAKLYQYSEMSAFQKTESEAIHVRIRGYSDHDRKAVHMEGFILPDQNHVWLVQNLTVKKMNNDRAFFRLNTDTDASIVTLGAGGSGERVCRLKNISVGGVCISAEDEYHEGDKFLLKVKLLEDMPQSIMYCQVLRIIKKTGSDFQYGCCFLEMTEEDQEKIIKNIFEAQRKMRASS